MGITNTQQLHEKAIKITMQVFVVILLIFIASLFIRKQERPSLSLSKQETALNFNNKFLLLFNMGNRRFFADVLWLQTLIESDIEHYQKKDLNNWMFLRFDSIFNLDPYFIEAYRFAGIYLSIVKFHPAAAEDIYIRALKKFPHDYELNYQAAFHYMIDRNDNSKALIHYKRIMNHPKAPGYIKRLTARLSVSQGENKTYALELLYQMKRQHKGNEHILQGLEKQIYALKAEIDLNCLNTNRTNCNKFDHFGNSYHSKNGKYSSEYNYQKFRAKSKNSNKWVL